MKLNMAQKDFLFEKDISITINKKSIKSLIQLVLIT